MTKHLRALYNRRFEFVMIDEYQDTNRSQYELMRLLTEERRNVCVVGDEDQSIYGWRGADIRNILDFERDYPHAVVIRLEQNYRSTKNILEAASAVVANNKERKGKWLVDRFRCGRQDRLLRSARRRERSAVHRRHDREAARDRIRASAWRFCTARTSNRGRLKRRCGDTAGSIWWSADFSFYQRAEVKDLLAYLKVLLSPHDSVSLLRIINTPARGIGKGTVEQIEQYALEHGTQPVECAAQDAGREACSPRGLNRRSKRSCKLLTELGEAVANAACHGGFARDSRANRLRSHAEGRRIAGSGVAPGEPRRTGECRGRSCRARRNRG